MMNLKSQDISTKHSGDGLDLDSLLAQNPKHLALRRPSPKQAAGESRMSNIQQHLTANHR